VGVAMSIGIVAVALVVLRHGAARTPSVVTPGQHAVSGLPPVPPLSPANKHLLTFFTKAERTVREHDKGCVKPIVPQRPRPTTQSTPPSAALLATFSVLRGPAERLRGFGGLLAHVAQRRYGITFAVATDNTGFPIGVQATPGCQKREFAELGKLLARAPRAERRHAIQLAHDQLLDQQYVEHHPQSICLFGSGGGCEPFLYAQARGGLQSAGSGSNGSTFSYLVPDGVTTVTARYPREGPRTGFRRRYPPITVSARVINNVAVWKLDNEPGDIFPTVILWRTSTGKVIRTAYQG
jgi:hypothetical protein